MGAAVGASVGASGGGCVGVSVGAATEGWVSPGSVGAGAGAQPANKETSSNSASKRTKTDLITVLPSVFYSKKSFYLIIASTNNFYKMRFLLYSAKKPLALP